MTTYTYSSIEIVDGRAFLVGRSESGNGPAETVRIALGGWRAAWDIASNIRTWAREVADNKPLPASYTLVDALQTPSPARDEAMRQADARKGTE